MPLAPESSTILSHVRNLVPHVEHRGEKGSISGIAPPVWGSLWYLLHSIALTAFTLRRFAGRQEPRNVTREAVDYPGAIGLGRFSSGC